MTRRGLLQLTGACPLLRRALASPSHEAQNLSYPLQAIDGAITPADFFFVRDHFAEPELPLDAWRLKIEGRVAHPLELSLADLLESPTKKLEAVLECAGNTAGGTAVGMAGWQGGPLPQLLDRAGVANDAAAVLLQGADIGRLLQNS